MTSRGVDHITQSKQQSVIELSGHVREMQWLQGSQLTIARTGTGGGAGSSGKTYANTGIVIARGPDGFVRDKFPEVTDLALVQCGQNFVHYNLRGSVFPKLQRVYLNSHPCDSSVLHGLHQWLPNVVIYVAEHHYRYYYDRWWDGSDAYVRCVGFEDFNAFLERCKESVV